MRLTHRWLVAVFVGVETFTVADATIAAQPGWEEVVKTAEKEGEVTVYATALAMNYLARGKFVQQ